METIASRMPKWMRSKWVKLVISFLLGNLLPGITLVGIGSISGLKGVASATVIGYAITTFTVVVPNFMLTGGISELVIGKIAWDTVNNLAAWIFIIWAVKKRTG